MYPYNYVQNYNNSIYTPATTYASSNINSNDERFIGGGLIAPLLLGGVAGYAIGQNNYNNRPYMFYAQPYYNPYYNYYPYPYYRR